ncbi:expressed unknown protein [Seminavis robusta]|uniref:Uncharacterized protein n=1 Tax=Seminavis robusta TaxID=568900 RepID=A0A9N8H5F1_9STRA|nr:expressed unknown protein [Seminavis robusta]|eukprot:Sro73_g040180.1 n/a (573) ;mRNA; r:3942-5660
MMITVNITPANIPDAIHNLEDTWSNVSFALRIQAFGWKNLETYSPVLDFITRKLAVKEIEVIAYEDINFSLACLIASKTAEAAGSNPSVVKLSLSVRIWSQEHLPKVAALLVTLPSITSLDLCTPEEVDHDALPCSDMEERKIACAISSMSQLETLKLHVLPPFESLILNQISGQRNCFIRLKELFCWQHEVDGRVPAAAEAVASFLGSPNASMLESLHLDLEHFNEEDSTAIFGALMGISSISWLEMSFFGNAAPHSQNLATYLQSNSSKLLQSLTMDIADDTVLMALQNKLSLTHLKLVHLRGNAALSLKTLLRKNQSIASLQVEMAYPQNAELDLLVNALADGLVTNTSIKSLFIQVWVQHVERAIDFSLFSRVVADSSCPCALETFRIKLDGRFTDQTTSSLADLVGNPDCCLENVAVDGLWSDDERTQALLVKGIQSNLKLQDFRFVRGNSSTAIQQGIRAVLLRNSAAKAGKSGSLPGTGLLHLLNYVGKTRKRCQISSSQESSCSAQVLYTWLQNHPQAVKKSKEGADCGTQSLSAKHGMFKAGSGPKEHSTEHGEPESKRARLG